MVDALTMRLTNIEEHGFTPVNIHFFIFTSSFIQFKNYVRYPSFQFHQLFWECMLPEWALRIFMDRFDLTRKEAIDHLTKHERANVLNARVDYDRLEMESFRF